MSSHTELKLESPVKVRVRFAPSPTGYLHIGGARTCLFNFIFARQHEGELILRIEDTDKERSKKEFEEDIIEGLRWLGIEWDEGPDIDGKYGPYRQSERIEIYEKYLKELLDKNLAYYCFCSPEDLEAERQYRLSQGLPPIYSGKCATLDPQESRKRAEKGEKAIIRFRNPGGTIEIEDMVRGKVEFDAGLLGDFTIAKSTTGPLYNFANVVDDHEMRITHVIRGEEHLANTPKQILLQKALGFPTPVYAHLPLILAPDKSKLSKRHGAVSVREFREKGYLPEALLNFIALLGWHPSGDREIFSLSELVSHFSLKRVKKSGAIFNIEKLNSLNGYYLRKLSPKEFALRGLPFLIEKGFVKLDFELKERGEIVGFFGTEPEFKIILPQKENQTLEWGKFERIMALFQERTKVLSELPETAFFFFVKEIDYPSQLLLWKEYSPQIIREALKRALKALESIPQEDWSADSLQEKLLSTAQEFNPDRGVLLWPLRVALSGLRGSPPPFEIAYFLGKEETLERVKRAIEKLS